MARRTQKKVLAAIIASQGKVEPVLCTVAQHAQLKEVLVKSVQVRKPKKVKSRAKKRGSHA